MLYLWQSDGRPRTTVLWLVGLTNSVSMSSLLLSWSMRTTMNLATDDPTVHFETKTKSLRLGLALRVS